MIKLSNSEEYGHMKMIELKDHLKINLSGHLKIDQKRKYFAHNYDNIHKYTINIHDMCLTYICFDMNLALE